MSVPAVPGALGESPDPNPSAKKWLGWLKRNFKLGVMALVEVVIAFDFQFNGLMIRIKNMDRALFLGHANTREF